MSIVNRADNRAPVQPQRITTRVRDKGVEQLIDNIKNRNDRGKRFKKENREAKPKSKIKNIIANHIKDNIKEYIIVTIIFLIGITAGVIFVNNVNESQAQEIQGYINQFINAVKGDYHIDTSSLLKNSLIDNFKLVVCMWFIGSTVIGMPIVLGIVLFRGFCIGYTVSAAIAVLGTQKGISFFLTTIFLQNMIFIPVLLALAVSGINLYKSIMRDKRKENIKLEIIRHTLCSILFFIVLIIASLVEVYVSANLLTVCIGFF